MNMKVGMKALTSIVLLVSIFFTGCFEIEHNIPRYSCTLDGYRHVDGVIIVDEQGAAIQCQ